jgi:hypothetical protein
MGTRGVPPISRGIMFSLAFWGVAWSAAWATSGIRFEGPVMLDASNPPCNAPRATTYQMTLKNTNCVCNEDLRVNVQTKAADALNEIDTEDTPSGSFKFIGFSESQGGPFSLGNYQLTDMEDETSKTIFFQVETGPVDCVGGNGGISCRRSSAWSSATQVAAAISSMSPANRRPNFSQSSR